MEIPSITIETETHIIYPDIGKIFNKKSKKFCGTKTKDGYLKFKLNGKTYYNHRFIYEMYNSVNLLPDQQINHINHQRDDNRIENLEIVNNQQNQQWRNKHKNNTSGYKGVCKSGNNWKAKIRYNNKTINLGTYETKEEAAMAYNDLAQDLNENCDCLYKLNIII